MPNPGHESAHCDRGPLFSLSAKEHPLITDGNVLNYKSKLEETEMILVFLKVCANSLLSAHNDAFWWKQRGHLTPHDTCDLT